MNEQLASSKASKEIIIEADDSLVTGLMEYFSLKGLKVLVIGEDQDLKEECDVCIYTINCCNGNDSLYFFPRKKEGYCPEVTIGLKNNRLSNKRLLKEIIAFLEAINF